VTACTVYPYKEKTLNVYIDAIITLDEKKKKKKMRREKQKENYTTDKRAGDSISVKTREK
jgi:hypothetical protein